MHLLVGSDHTITSPVFVGPDEETPEACTAPPPVTVTSVTGEVLAAPAAAAPGDETGRYTVKLTSAAHTGGLDRLEVVWLGDVAGSVQRHRQTVHVVGGHYASLVELRADPDLANPDRVTGDALRLARDSFARLVVQYRGASWVGAAHRDVVMVEPGEPWAVTRRFVRDVLAVTVDGVTVDPGSVAVSPARFVTATAPLRGRVEIAYTYGLEEGIPDVLRRACLAYVHAAHSGGGLPDNALSWSGEGGTYRASTANWEAGRPTGVMAVDDLLNEADDYRSPVMG